MTTTDTLRYAVIDRHTGATISTHTTRARASAKRDRLDNAYGAYRYYVQQVQS